jgi:uncharacterized phage protein (predicted DNA packaging)
LIKKHLRIDGNEEDDLLLRYGAAAEAVILQLCSMSYDEMVAKYGAMPVELENASLLLVEVSYKERGPVSVQNMSVVPYSFDLLVKPYMAL